MNDETLDPSYSRAQRMSDKAEVEMMVIRESMTRVNEALRRTSLDRSPRSLLHLSRVLREEDKIQEEASLNANRMIAELSRLMPHPKTLPLLEESIGQRVNDLRESLLARTAGMSAAKSSPRRWMKMLQWDRYFRAKTRIKIMEALWKVDILLAVVLLFIPFDGWPPTTSNMLASGVAFLLAGIASTAAYSAPIPRAPRNL